MNKGIALFAVPGIFFTAKCNAIPIEWIADTPDHFAVQFNFEYMGPNVFDIIQPDLFGSSPSGTWAFTFFHSGRDPSPFLPGPLYESDFMIWQDPFSGFENLLRTSPNIVFGTDSSRPLTSRGEFADTFETSFSWNITQDGSGYVFVEGVRKVPDGGATFGLLVIGVSGVMLKKRYWA
jgi:hypothetical protein